MSLSTFLQIIPSPIKSIILRKTNENLFNIYALRVWQKLFIKVSKESNVIDKEEIKKIASSRALTRQLYSMFDEKELLDVSKLTVAIGMEALDQKTSIKPHDIISFSFAFYEAWFKELENNEILKSRLNSSFVNNLSDLNSILNQGLESNLLTILSDPNLLRIKFFKTYSHPERITSRKIKVFLPNKNDYIDSNSPTISINVNSYNNIDLGFFRIGYDYNLMDSNERAWVVAISKNKKAEAVKFNQQQFGDQSSDYIWIR